MAEGRIHHLCTTVADIVADGTRFHLALADGSTLPADSVFLALTHPAPTVPVALAALKGSEVLVTDPFAPGALEGIGRGERVLIAGSGLTSADIVATLDQRGHAGAVHVISRHGWRSKPHGPTQRETAEDFARDPATTALGLLRRVRRALADDADAGLTWHAGFDRLRGQGPAIWAALPQDERKRFLRHLRGLWDVHRFRIAPQAFHTLGRLEQSRHARLLVGKQQTVDIGPAGLRIAWRARSVMPPDSRSTA